MKMEGLRVVSRTAPEIERGLRLNESAAAFVDYCEEFNDERDFDEVVQEFAEVEAIDPDWRDETSEAFSELFWSSYLDEALAENPPENGRELAQAIAYADWMRIYENVQSQADKVREAVALRMYSAKTYMEKGEEIDMKEWENIRNEIPEDGNLGDVHRAVVRHITEDDYKDTEERARRFGELVERLKDLASDRGAIFDGERTRNGGWYVYSRPDDGIGEVRADTFELVARDILSLPREDGDGTRADDEADKFMTELGELTIEDERKDEFEAGFWASEKELEKAAQARGIRFDGRSWDCTWGFRKPDGTYEKKDTLYDAAVAILAEPRTETESESGSIWERMEDGDLLADIAELYE